MNDRQDRLPRRRFARFFLVGWTIAGVEEFLSAGLFKGPGSFLAAMILVFPVYVSLTALTSPWLDRLFVRRGPQELAHLLVYGGIGLLFEWLVMGLAPWSKPDAPLLLMAGFQLGMFSFWTSVSFLPRLAASPDERSRRTWRRVMRFYVSFFAMLYVVVWLTPAAARFPVAILSIIAGHLVVNLFLAGHIWNSFQAGTAVAEGEGACLQHR